MSSDANYATAQAAAGAQGATSNNTAAYLAQLAGQRDPQDGGMGAMVNQFSGLGVNGPDAGSNAALMGMHLPHYAYPAATQHGGFGYLSSYPAPYQSAQLPLKNEHFLMTGGLGWPAQGAISGGYGHDFSGHFFAPPMQGFLPKPTTEKLPHDVPGLDNPNRRSSHSTVADSTPTTPFFGSTASRDGGAPRVTVFDHRRSPFTTPSPQQLTASGLVPQPKGLFANPIPIPVDQELKALLLREPAIPQAVPAVFTPQENMKTLDQSLTNHIPGNRNVYIRGLHPTTDDDLLYKYAERFGRVETSKAIIDTTTGACKGFGFAKFYNLRDSEACIRGFYHLGYEVGFARVIPNLLQLSNIDPRKCNFTEEYDAAWMDRELQKIFREAKEDEERRVAAALIRQATPSPVLSEAALAETKSPKGKPIYYSKCLTHCLCECSAHSVYTTKAPTHVERCYCFCKNKHRFDWTNFDAFDQESFNSRLKAEGDDNSTNLYISNLPKSLTENELSAIFIGYTIMSSKILRDGLGNSRGVGFARFESREVCDEIIKTFTGQPLGEEGLYMQIRYADTPAQKELKRVTAERRQFRTNEYNVSAYGTAAVGMDPSMYSQSTWGSKRTSSAGSNLNLGRGISHVRDCKVGQGKVPPSSVASGNIPSLEDGTADEGDTIRVESPLVANGSTHSSPVKQIKQEKD